MEAGCIVIVVMFGLMAGAGLGLVCYRWYKARVGDKPDGEGLIDNFISWDGESNSYSLI
jgi:hypothetical protein